MYLLIFIYSNGLQRNTIANRAATLHKDKTFSNHIPDYHCIRSRNSTVRSAPMLLAYSNCHSTSYGKSESNRGSSSSSSSSSSSNNKNISVMLCRLAAVP